jgi:molybdopterin-guanine dinucleotide biosynthesis protein
MKADRPFIIGIGGAHSSAGKTTLASAIIEYLSSGRPCSVFKTVPRIGAIKYTKENIFASINDDEALIRQKGKDTARLSEAGAEKTLWIRSSEKDIGETLPLALERMSGFDVVVIEGNSAVEAVKSDIIIFIEGSADGETKPSAERLRRIADIIVERDGSSLNHMRSLILKDLPGRVDDDGLGGIIKRMEETAKKKEIAVLLGRKAEEGRITCAAARQLADEAGVPYSVVGAVADELGIKIRNCELGCF